MATRISVALEDDLDGVPAAETVRFGLGGADYEIDLNKKNVKAFRKQLAPFVEHARNTRRGPRRHSRRTHQAVSAAAPSGLGRRPGHPGQRTWARPGERCGAVRGRYYTTVTQAWVTAGANHPRQVASDPNGEATACGWSPRLPARNREEGARMCRDERLHCHSLTTPRRKTRR